MQTVENTVAAVFPTAEDQVCRLGVHGMKSYDRIIENSTEPIFRTQGDLTALSGVPETEAAVGNAEPRLPDMKRIGRLMS